MAITKAQPFDVEFVHGDIEDMPFDDELSDVIISNCVLNLVPDKEKLLQRPIVFSNPAAILVFRIL